MMDPISIHAWIDERYAQHKAERRDAGDAREDAALVGAMLELHELRSWLSRQGHRIPA